jgi:glucose/arabinose dehydrogenase
VSDPALALCLSQPPACDLLPPPATACCLTASEVQRLCIGLLGKVARINTDGSIPKDNPFVGTPGVREEIFSIGHRNIQSAAIHPTTGELWEVEHGTRGGDELNVVRKGKDYGWPKVAYGIEYAGGPITGGISAKEGTEQPLYFWDPVIGPSGMALYTGNLFPAWKNSLFIGGHQTNDLVRLTLNGEKVTGEERLLTDRAPRLRIRDVRQGPDGALYLLTDEPLSGKLLKLVPKGTAKLRWTIALATEARRAQRDIPSEPSLPQPLTSEVLSSEFSLP